MNKQSVFKFTTEYSKQKTLNFFSFTTETSSGRAFISS